MPRHDKADVIINELLKVLIDHIVLNECGRLYRLLASAVVARWALRR